MFLISKKCIQLKNQNIKENNLVLTEQRNKDFDCLYIQDHHSYIVPPKPYSDRITTDTEKMHV